MNKSVRVCHVCAGHSANDGRVFWRECRSMAQAGFETYLIAGSPASSPYVKEGVRVFPLSNGRPGLIGRLLRALRAGKLAAATDADIFHVHEPELLHVVKWLTRSQTVVFDAHESYVDVLRERQWIPSLLRPMLAYIWDRLEQHSIRSLAGVITVTEPIAHRYRALHHHVRVVANYPDLSGFDPTCFAGERDGKTCVYVGALRPDRGISQIIQALAILRDRGLNIPLRLAGPSAPGSYCKEILSLARHLGLSDLVSYHGIIEKCDVMPFQARGSIGLITYLPLTNSIKGLPNKLLECMGAGLPVVYSDFPVYRSIAGPCNGGIAVDPTDPSAIAAAISDLAVDPVRARQMGARGRAEVIARFCWNSQEDELLAFYSEILDAGIHAGRGRNNPSSQITLGSQ